MVKESITLRVNKDMRDLIDYACKQLGTNITDLITDCLIHFFKSLNNLKKTDVLHRIETAKRTATIKAKIRSNNAMRYTVRNFYRNMFQLAQSFVLNRGDVPEKLIINSIDEITELYAEFPFEMKLELHKEILAIEELRDMDVFKRRYKQYMELYLGVTFSDKKLKYDEKLEEIEK